VPELDFSSDSGSRIGAGTNLPEGRRLGRVDREQRLSTACGMAKRAASHARNAASDVMITLQAGSSFSTNSP
jgi:hypothetical protein